MFVVEFCIKNIVFGCYGYWRGPDRYWNWFDTVLTSFSVIDGSLSVVTEFSGNDMEGGATRLLVTLRACRLARIARFIKLLRAPLVRELANMLFGCFIGIRSLVWTFVLLGLFLYMVGVAFRQSVGPADNQNYTRICGFGDNLAEDYDDCKKHWLYGEEFFFHGAGLHVHRISVRNRRLHHQDRTGLSCAVQLRLWCYF